MSLPSKYRGKSIRVELDYWPRGVDCGQARKAMLAPALAATGMPVKRRILEWCCGPNSHIGSHPCTKKGCLVTRVTEKEDGTTEHGTNIALKQVSEPRCLLFSSMPCTGGSPWTRINIKRPGGYAIHRRHIRLFNKLWHNFEIIARQAHAAGNPVAIEWPRGCSYWRLPKVQALCKELGLKFADFDGCRFGIRSISSGLPILKPWRIATNNYELYQGFKGMKCSGCSKHAPCAGKDTKLTENYSKSMVDLIHACWKKSAHSSKCMNKHP